MWLWLCCVALPCFFIPSFSSFIWTCTCTYTLHILVEILDCTWNVHVYSVSYTYTFIIISVKFMFMSCTLYMCVSHWATERNLQVDRALSQDSAGIKRNDVRMDARLSGSMSHDVWRKNAIQRSNSGTIHHIRLQDYCERVPTWVDTHTHTAHVYTLWDCACVYIMYIRVHWAYTLCNLKS